MAGVLSGRRIRELLKRDVTDKDGLVVTPLLDPKQVGADGIDITLGTYFIVYKRTGIPCVGFGPKAREVPIPEFQSKVHVPLGEQIIVPPSTFILGGTLEYLKLPMNVFGEVATRSSWGRLGLVIATAINVHPAFRGCLTLEIVNHGEISIALTPGSVIGQLVLHELEECARPKRDLVGKYVGATRPEFSKLGQERGRIRRCLSVSRKYHGVF